MINKAGLLLLSLLTLNTSFADSLLAKEYQLLPGVSLVVTNNSNTQVTVLCEAHMVENKIHSLAIKALRGSGSFNGTSINVGQKMVQSLHHMQVVSIVANKNAQAEFINLSDLKITAYCSIND